jgi:hypothetical protein
MPIVNVMQEHELKNAYIGEYRLPWDKILWYYPLEIDANDYSWKWNNATWVWTASYTTAWDKTAAHFSWNDNYIDTRIVAWSWPITIACLFYHETVSSSSYETVMWTPLTWDWSSNPHIWMCFYGNRFYRWAGKYRESETSAASQSANTWHFWAIRIDASGNVKLTINSTEATWTTASWTINSNIFIWAWVGNRFHGNVKNVWIWGESLSDSDLAKFKAKITA